MRRCLSMLLALHLFVPSAQSAEIAWSKILTSDPEIKLPKPLPKVEWRKKLQPALELAQKENRPLFVTFRCLPCKQCESFDKEVLDGGPSLDPLLKQFVTVRITNAEHIYLNVFPVEGYQDLDLSWWGYFLSPKGQAYPIFGGKDHVSAATRISTGALMSTMKRVLKHHYNPERDKWNVDGKVPDLTKMTPTFKLPGIKSWAKKAHEREGGCLHCHHVAEILRQPALDADTFDLDRDLQMWPLPENVGIKLDRDDGLLIKAVEASSAASKAGLKAGDSLAAAGDRKLFGQADFRGVLHRGPKKSGSIPVVWMRDGKVMQGELKVEDGWRKTILDWRMSVSQGNIGSGPAFFPLKASPAERRKFKIKNDAMAIRPFMGGKNMGPARKAGLRNNHVVTAVNGKSPNVVGRGFLVWFRLNHKPGAKITLTVREPNGKERELTYQTAK